MTSTFYRTVWRWHFYAGLLVLPLVILLSLSGALFLFKPQVERWKNAPSTTCRPTMLHRPRRRSLQHWPPSPALT